MMDIRVKSIYPHGGDDMLIIPKFNLQEFYEHGYTLTHIQKPIADRLLEVMRRQRFIPESQKKPTNPMLPDWDTAFSSKTSDNVAPPEFQEFWDQIAAHDYFSYFHLIWGEFSQKNIMAQKYLRGSVVPPHQDVHEGMHITNILYLSGDKFDLSDGGYLRCGKWQLDSAGWGKLETVRNNSKVLPQHGSLVTICNMVPTFCHSVETLASDKERYSLICRMGYKENAEKNKLGALF